MLNNHLKLIFRLLVSFFLLYYIFKNIEISEFIEYLSHIPVHILVISIMLAMIIKLIQSLRWGFVLREKKAIFNSFTLFSFCMIAGFFNLFLPSVIGGDALRIAYIKNNNLSLLSAANTVLFERLVGLYALFIMSAVAIVLGWNIVVAEIRITAMTISTIGILLMTLVFFFYDKFLDFVESISIKYSNRITLNIHSFFKSLDFSIYSNKIFGICFCMTVFMYILGVGVIIMIGNALGLEEISISYYLIIIPIINIITLIPISLGGFGVREGLYVLFLTPLGISIEQSTLLSLLSFSPFIFVGLLGGLFYLFDSYSYKEVVK